MCKKIRLEQVEQASWPSRHLVTLSAMMATHKYHLHFATYIFTYTTIWFSLLSYSLYYYRHSIDVLAVVMHHMMVIFNIFTATIIGIVWKDCLINLFEEAYWSYNYGSAIMLEKLTEIKNKCAINIKTKFRYTIRTLFYTMVNMNILPICESYLNGDNRQLIFPCWLPFKLDSIAVYIAVLICEEIMVFHMVFVVFGAITITLYFQTHIKSEFDLLKYALTKINERAYEMARNVKGYRENDICDDNIEILKRCYIICIRRCAQHHSEIISYFNSGMRVLDVIYFMIFITELLVCSCTGFALISNNTPLKLKFIGIMIVQLVFLYAACWVPESIAEESLTISDVIYTMEWYTFPKDCQVTLMIMMTRSTQPLLMKLLTGQVVDFTGYMSLIKASYSYFNMMLTTTQ